MRGGLSPVAAARRWLACALALAALAAVVGQPAPPPPAYASSHTAADNPGKYWAPGTADTYKFYTHTNQWRCAGRGTWTHPTEGVQTRGCLAQPLTGSESLDAAAAGTVLTRTCRVSSSDPALATGGCGHTGGNGWVWVDGAYHGQPNTPIGNPICSATGLEVSSAALCGEWVACGAGTQPNAAATACVACPTGQHSHGGASSAHANRGCLANHTPPTCLPGVSASLRQEWRPHEPLGGHTTVTRPGCVADPEPDCEPTADTPPRSQHRHSEGGDCEPDHGAAEPVCGAVASQTTLTWTVHGADGANEGRSKVCCPAGQTAVGGGFEDPPPPTSEPPTTTAPPVQQPVSCPSGQVPQTDSGGTVRCYKQCPGGGWIAAAGGCRPATASRFCVPARCGLRGVPLPLCPGAAYAAGRSSGRQTAGSFGVVPTSATDGAAAPDSDSPAELCYSAPPLQRHRRGSTMARAARALLADGLPNLDGGSRAMALSAAPGLDRGRRQ